MEPLGPPSRHHVQAALGWLELGNPREAEAELQHVPEQFHSHPEVLRVKWEMQSRRGDWLDSLDLARKLVRLDPHNPDHWIKQSYSLHELGRTREAWQQLRTIRNRFPQVSTIPYNLACYACQMGETTEAKQWLGRAMRIGGREEIRALSLSDRDLEPLWDFIRGL